MSDYVYNWELPDDMASDHFDLDVETDAKLRLAQS